MSENGGAMPQGRTNNPARCLGKTATIISKERVTNYGEVLTPRPIVDAMLDLVKQETVRIDSRFLEPACGTGNFLVEILRRKLQVVQKRYAKNQIDYERYAVLAVSSLYGIDILADNAEECRQRLYQTFDAAYTTLFGDKITDACRAAVRYILSRNIVHGDALTLQTVGENPQPIVFSEWSLVGGSLLKRRDFVYSFLVEKVYQCRLFNDQMEAVTINEPVKDYPPVHFLEAAHAYDDRL